MSTVNATGKFANRTMTQPKMGPMAVPMTVNFIADTEVEIDLSQLYNNDWLDQVAGVYVDNISNAGTLTLIMDGTKQRITVSPSGWIYMPILVTEPPKVYVTSTEDATVNFQWYNNPIFPIAHDPSTGGGAASDVNITGSISLPVTGPLTDVQLRASAVPIVQNGVAYTDRSIANLSGASEQLMAANAARRLLVIHNIGATSVGVNLTGGAASLTAAGSIVLVAGNSLVLDNYPPTSAITIIGTLNADVTAYEG